MANWLKGFKGMVEKIKSSLKISQSKESLVVLTVPEFIAAGDHLIAECPDWSWYSAFLKSLVSFYEDRDSLNAITVSFSRKYFCLGNTVVHSISRQSGELSKVKSYLPSHKQFLVTRSGQLRYLLIYYSFLDSGCIKLIKKADSSHSLGGFTLKLDNASTFMI